MASSGVVHGVIVCTVDVCGSSGEWGGRLPVEFMGCPPGCRLVLQAQQTSDGNVAGWHGGEVRYDDDSGSFSLPNGGSLRSGDRLEDAVFPTTTVSPSTTVESSPITAEETRTIIVNDRMYASVDEMAVGETTVVLGERSLTIDLPTIGVAGSEYEVTFDPDGPSAPLTLAEGVVLESQSSKVERLAVTRPWRVVVSLRGVDKSKGKIAIELKVRGSKILVSQFRLAPTQKFKTCSAMRKVYPQGVAASRAARVVKRGIFVSSASARPIVSPVIYAKHRSLDTDRDRVVCER